MALRSSLWKEDKSSKDDLTLYFQQRLQRSETLSFVSRDYPQYTWSLRTLDRRCTSFGIARNGMPEFVELEHAVQEELNGPGRLLGYRAMHNKIRQIHHLNATRDMVHDMMTHLDPEGLQNRLPCFKKKKAKGSFVTKGANWVHSIDGHAELMGYQRDTFPLAIYGCIDTASRKLLWIKVWTDNSNLLVVA